MIRDRCTCSMMFSTRYPSIYIARCLLWYFDIVPYFYRMLGIYLWDIYAVYSGCVLSLVWQLLFRYICGAELVRHQWGIYFEEIVLSHYSILWWAVEPKGILFLSHAFGKWYFLFGDGFYSMSISVLKLILLWYFLWFLGGSWPFHFVWFILYFRFVGLSF